MTRKRKKSLPGIFGARVAERTVAASVVATQLHRAMHSRMVFAAKRCPPPRKLPRTAPCPPLGVTIGLSILADEAARAGYWNHAYARLAMAVVAIECALEEHPHIRASGAKCLEAWAPLLAGRDVLADILWFTNDCEAAGVPPM